MATTIQVKEDLLDRLEDLKKELKAKSYDEVIRYLIRKAKRLERSHFGTLPKIKSFKREEVDRLS